MAIQVSDSVRAFVAEKKALSAIQEGDIVVHIPRSAFGTLSAAVCKGKRNATGKPSKEICLLTWMTATTGIEADRGDGKIVSCRTAGRVSISTRDLTEALYMGLPVKGADEKADDAKFAAE